MIKVSENIVWHKIPETAEEFADAMIREVNVKNSRLCMVKLNDHFFAFANKCPHQGASLHDAVCGGNNEVVCAWHKYRFSLHTGRATSGSGEYLPVYPVKRVGNELYIGLTERIWEIFGIKI